MEDKLLSLHTNLIKDGYDLPDYDTFKTDMSDSVNSKKLHETLLSDGYEMPDYEVFLGDMGIKKKVASKGGGVSANVSAQVSSEEQPPLEQPKEDKSPLQLEFDNLYSGIQKRVTSEATAIRNKYESLIQQNPEKQDQLNSDYAKEIDSLNKLRTAEFNIVANNYAASYKEKDRLPIEQLLSGQDKIETVRDYLKLRNVTPKMLGLQQGMNLDRKLREGELVNYDDLLEFKGLYQKPQEPKILLGAVKKYNLGVADFFSTLDNASKFLSNATGLPHGTAFKDMSEYIKWHESSLPDTPDTFVGNVLGGAAGLSSLFLELALTPEFKIKTLGKVVKIPKLITQLTGSSAVNRYAESLEEGQTSPELRNAIEGIKGAGGGLIQGAALTALGYGSGVLGKIVGEATGSGFIGATSSVASNAYGFGGFDAISQLISTGDIDWKKVEESTGIGAVLGIPAFAQYAGTRAWGNLMTASKNVMSLAQKLPYSPEGARLKAFELRDLASKETDIQKRVAIEATANAIDALTDVKTLQDEIVQDPQRFIEAINRDTELNPMEKQQYVNRINEIVNDRMRSPSVALLENELTGLHKELASIESDPLAVETTREMKSKLIKDKIKNHERALMDILNKRSNEVENQKSIADLNEVQFVAQLKDDDGNPSKDIYTVDVKGKRRKIEVPIQGDKTFEEQSDIIAKEKETILAKAKKVTPKVKVIEEPTQTVTEEPQAEPTPEPTPPKVEEVPTEVKEEVPQELSPTKQEEENREELSLDELMTLASDKLKESRALAGEAREHLANKNKPGEREKGLAKVKEAEKLNLEAEEYYKRAKALQTKKVKEKPTKVEGKINPTPTSVDPIELAKESSDVDWFHGTKEGFDLTKEKIDPISYGDVGSLVGLGLYTTADPNIAKKYAGQKGKVFRLNFNPRKVINGDIPIPKDVLDVYRKNFGDDSQVEWSGVINDVLKKNPNISLVQLHLGILEEAAYAEITKESVMDRFQDLSSDLSDLGYDGITHEGGKTLNQKTRHRVLILFDPEGIYSAEHKNITTDKREYKETVTEPISKPVEPLSTTKGITAPLKVESVTEKEAEGQGKQKRAGFEKRETEKGTKGSVELRGDEIGKVVKNIIDKNPHFYEVSHRADAIEAAKAYIIDNGIDNAYADLITKTKDIDKLPIRHVARQVLMQYYAGKLVELNKQNDKRGADALADRILELEDRAQKEVRISGTTSSFTMWSFLDPQASVFMAEKLVKEVNKQKLGFEDEAAKDFLEKWNEEVPTMVKQLLTENKEFKDTIEKLESRIKGLEGKKPTTSRVTKEKAKEIATKIRSLKSTNWGFTFADPVGAVVIMDGALELAAKTVEVTGNVIQAVNDGIKYIKATDWYKGLSSDNKKEVEKGYRDRIRGEFDFEAEEYVKGTSWYRRESEGLSEPTKEQQAKKEYAKTKKESDERLRDQIYDIIAAHWLVEKESGTELADKLQEELGLTKSEAKKIADIAISTFETGAQKVFDKTLAPKLPNKAKKKLAFDKFFGLIKRGVLNDSNYADLFAEKYKLRKGLTPDEKRELLRLGLNAEKLAPYGHFGDLAMNEFMQYMAKLTDMDNWATRQTKLMIAANYARMLSGLTTHWINLSSSGVNIAARPLLTLNNWERWFDAAYAYSTGNKMKARLINPMAELYYMAPSYVAGTKIGFNQAMNIVKHGNIKEASKYMETVGNKRGMNVPVLEKSTYGKGKAFRPLGTQKFDVNVFNKMKYSGRALIAEDMQMFNVPFSLALAMSARSKAIREGTTLSEKELRKKIIGEIQGTFLTEKQAKDVDLQLKQELKALTDAKIEVDAGQIKQRKFEIVRSLLNLEPEVVEEATQSARSEIFTGERGGIFSKLSDVASKLFNMNVVVKVAGLPHVPFTTVVGRIADYSLDGIPGYGSLRALGASPTGIIARARYWNKTGNWKDFFESPASIGEFKSAQMGSIGSPAYYQQTNRMYLGMLVMTVGAALLLRDDPDDGSEPRWDITGALSYADMDKKQWHPMGAYTIKIPVPGSKKGIHIRYLNFPLVNFMLGTLGNYKDHIRAGKDDEELPAKLGLALHSMFHSLGMIKDTSLAQGISDFLELIGNTLRAIGSGDEKEILREEDLMERTPENKALIKSLTDMKDDYLQVPLRYVDPLKSNLIQQIWKGITPEGRLKGTSWQLLYYNLGIQNITNDKRTDIFGQEVKVMPGDQGIAWPRPQDDRWKKIWDYNIDLTDITYHDRKNVEGVNRTLEWDEYIERKAKANQLFKKRFDEYFTKLTPEDIKEKRDVFHIEKASARKRNELDKELNDIWKKTKEDVDKAVFDWKEHYKKEPVIFNKLMERSLVPDFYNERQEVDGRKILVPYNLLETMNKETMDAFLTLLKPQEKNDAYWDDSGLEKAIKRKWNSSIENPKKKMIDELQKRYGKTSKVKK